MSILQKETSSRSIRSGEKSNKSFLCEVCKNILEIVFYINIS